MLLTGIRTPLGIKLYGGDQAKLQEYALLIEKKLKDFNQTLSVSSDKVNSGYFLNIDVVQERLSRYGITKEVMLNAISKSVGGEQISTLIDGLKRYPISIRLEPTQRQDITTLNNLQIKTQFGFFPLNYFATLSYAEGASVIKSEKGMKVTFIYITPQSGVSSKSYKDAASKLLSDLKLPSGYYFEWAGESQYLESAMERLAYIVPATFVIILFLIYMALRDIWYALAIFVTLPFALGGGLLYIEYLNYNLSIAVIVGFLALLGVASETAIIMMIYLEEAIQEKLAKVKKLGKKDIQEAIYHGAVLRIRPKLMTVFAILGGLIPIMYINGVGSEVMRAIAAPMIGGMISSTILTLIIIPLLFYSIMLRRYRV